jgi:hypothetical protein
MILVTLDQKKENTKMTDNVSNMFSFDLAEADEVNNSIEGQGRIRDGGICVCGHPSSRHTWVPERGRSVCQPTKLYCACMKKDVYIEVSDTRFFLRKTLGNGPEHAFSRGVAAAIKAGVDIKIIKPPICEPCGKEGVPVTPVRVTDTGRVTDSDSSGRNAFLCRECQIARS